MFLGDDAFVLRTPAALEGASEDVNVPRAQRRPPTPPLAEFVADCKDRDAAMAAAHATGEHSYQQIAEAFGVPFTKVGRVVRAAKAGSTRSGSVL